MNINIEEVNNGFIVNKPSSMAMRSSTPYVFETVDALCEHIRDTFEPEPEIDPDEVEYERLKVKLNK